MGYYAKVSDKPSRYMITPILKCVTPGDDAVLAADNQYVEESPSMEDRRV